MTGLGGAATPRKNTGTESLFEFPARIGRCDVCDGPLDVSYKADPDVGFRVCSRCDEIAQSQGGGSCTQDPDYVCNGWCSECEVNS